nr:nicotinate (nicotinamide) nucleotide adenylyltransferase [Helicobacter sp. 16-1353]
MFGGSFDPPHKGHFEIIKHLSTMDFLDLIIVLPAFLNPLKKQTLFSAQNRFEWLRILTKDFPKIIVSNYEIEQNKPNYTIDSILYFKKIYNPNRIFLVIGADIVKDLPKWHKIELIKKEVDFIIAKRDNISFDTIKKNAVYLEIKEPCKSSDIRGYLCGNFIDSKIESYLLDSIKSQIQNEVKYLKIKDRVDFIVHLLDSKKAEDIAFFDLTKSNYITQYVIIATSLADKHSFALLDTLKNELKPQGEIFYATDEDNGDWIIADLGDIMIHIFTQNHRKKFNLEEFLTNYQNNKIR